MINGPLFIGCLQGWQVMELQGPTRARGDFSAAYWTM